MMHDGAFPPAVGTVPPPSRDAPRQRVSLATSPILAAAASNDVAGVRWALEREGGSPDALLDWCGKVLHCTTAVFQPAACPAPSRARHKGVVFLLAAPSGSRL